MNASAPAASRSPERESKPGSRAQRGEHRAGHELAWALLAGFALAVAMTWPLAAHLSTDQIGGFYDPKLQAWELGWNRYALLHQPLHLWDANLYFPNAQSLAFSDALLGYTPLTIIGGGVHNTLIAYNLAVFTAFAFAFAGPYLLARELGCAPAAAVVAGVLYAWSPWRWSQINHLNIVSSGTIALSVALLLHGYRRDRPRAVVAGWLVAAWQISIGVSLGLYEIYLLAALAGVGAVLWHRAGRPSASRAVLRSSAGGIAVLAAVSVAILLPYFEVKAHHPEAAAQRIAQAHFLSPNLHAFLAAPVTSTLWAHVTGPQRKLVRWPDEMQLFPGVTLMVLAVIGLIGNAFSPRLRIGLLVMAVLCAVFSLGFTLDGGHFTYRLLYDHVPGWDGPRAPSRLHVLTTMSLAILAGGGATTVAAWASRALEGLRWHRVAPVAACGLLTLAGLAEAAPFRVHSGGGSGLVSGVARATVPRTPPGLGRLARPLLFIPSLSPAVWDVTIWTADIGFPKIVNGLSGFIPSQTNRILAPRRRFPDARSVRTFRAAGVRTVVVLRSYMDPDALARQDAAPIAGLGIARRRQGDLEIYSL